jgi:ribosomal protein S16
LVRIRLRRMGKKKQPVYRIVVADSHKPRDGRYIESLGYYDPMTEPSTIELNGERALYWLGQGAQPSGPEPDEDQGRLGTVPGLEAVEAPVPLETGGSNMKDLLEYLARALVDNPDDVQVEVIEGERSVILQLKVNPEDIGKVIGKQGRIAQALRTLVKAAATKQGKNAIVEILD